jgi:hypothetical protein
LFRGFGDEIIFCDFMVEGWLSGFKYFGFFEWGFEVFKGVVKFFETN